MTRPRSHYSRGEARRAALLDAAVEVIAAHGLEGVTHRAVARAADVPLSTTSYFFASLDDLIGAAVTRIAEGVLSTVDSLIPAAGTLTDDASVEEYLDRLVDFMAAAREHPILVQFEAYLGTTRRRDLAEPVRQIVGAYETRAAAVFAALGAPDPDTAARHLVAVLDGFALQRIAHPRDDDDRVLREAVRAVAHAHLPVRATPPSAI